MSPSIRTPELLSGFRDRERPRTRIIGEPEIDRRKAAVIPLERFQHTLRLIQQQNDISRMSGRCSELRLSPKWP